MDEQRKTLRVRSIDSDLGIEYVTAEPGHGGAMTYSDASGIVEVRFTTARGTFRVGDEVEVVVRSVEAKVHG